uniref:beta-ketoacyl-ACP synthase III n=1 Tax=Acetatifactor sp. TaxID=1872090 RepID=UPI004056F715
MIGKIRGTGSYAPERVLHNNDLAKFIDTNDEWIQERTGIAKRHIIEEDTTVTMAAKAAQRALENAGVQAEEIDLIILSTVSSNVILPCTACEVQKIIGAVNAVCYDINAACSGFLFALNTAQAYIHAGMIKKALLIGAESLSNIMNWQDRGTAILFGDGAGAAVLCAEEGNIYPCVMHSDGAKGDALMGDSRFRKQESSFPENVFSKTEQDAMEETDSKEHGIKRFPSETYVQMNGQEVFKFAVRQVPQAIDELLQLCNKTTDDIDLFVLHQANKRIVEGVAKRLKVEIDRFPMNLMEYGNTSSASIPILLDELNREGKLTPGMRLVLAGFGAGLSWGAAYMEW